MSHSLNKVYVHAVLITKYRYPYFKGEIKTKIIEKIKEVFNENDCNVLAINGYYDHLHVLFLQNANISIMRLMKLVKGKTSYYLNKELPETVKFGWSVGYGAFSVCPEHLDEKINYINNQETHHSK
jgi:REP element-mobilizing transposase RayT